MLDREQYLAAMIAKVQSEWGLGDDIAKGLCEISLKEFLADTKIEFGHPDFEWTKDDAETIAEIYILEYGETT